MKRTAQNSRKPLLRRLIPSRERDLARYTAFALYVASTVAIIGVSLVHGLAPENVNFWRLTLGIPAIAFGSLTLLAGAHLSDRAFYRAMVICLIPGFAVNAIILQISPATIAILTNLLISVMFAGYFIGRRELIAFMILATAIALSPLYTDVPGDTPHIAAWLSVFLPTMWAIALALHLQKVTIQRALKEVEEQSLTDPLTGLANLRAIRGRADELLLPEDPINPVKQNYAVMLIDIDNFKTANTLHGHLGGDRALRCVAEQLRRVAPEDALVARVGGDEFAVLAPIEDQDRVAEVSEVFRAAVRAAGVEMRLPGVAIDASVGMARYPVDGYSLDVLMTAADKSMYSQKDSHKANPRNATVQAPSGDHEPVAWIDADTGVGGQTEKSPFRQRLTHYTTYARFSTVGWLIGCTTVAVSLVMPDADHSHLVLAAAALLTGTFLTMVMLVINPQPLGWVQIAYDAITLGAIALIIGLTGGSDSPATVLVYLLIVFQAWFWNVRRIVWRALGPVVVLLTPLLYENVLAASHPEITIATLYAEVSVSLILTYSMYLNQVYLRHIERRVQRLASTDPLTGIPNRRAFNAYVEKQLAIAAKAGDRPELAIVMIDLDNFKDVNTAHGHHVGDVLLCDIATALSAAAREEDCVARVGGDEFAAVLPGAGVDGARALAERFVNAVAECTATNRERVLAAVTASAGFSLCPLHGDTLDDLMRSADDALMTVKTDGKGSARVSRLIVAI